MNAYASVMDRSFVGVFGLTGEFVLHAEDRRNRESAPDNEDADQALICGCLSGDDRSFAKLVERYERTVTGVLWHFTRDPIVLEELVQDTFVEAYFSLRRFRKNAPFFPWLRTIATRVGYQKWRQQRRDVRRRALLDGQGAATPCLSQSTFQAPSDTAAYVYQVLERLAPKDRLVLTLQYFEGCSTQEIADRVGWSLTLVKVRAFRARKRLRALLLEMEYTGHEFQ